jgi:hypothetical protein
MMKKGSSKKSLDFIFDVLVNKINLKNVYIHRTVVRSIWSLYHFSEIDNNDKTQILIKALETPGKELKGLSIITLLIKFKETLVLRNFIETKQDPILFLKDAVNKLFCSKFNLDGVEDIDSKIHLGF